jgi:hypothetical protein
MSCKSVSNQLRAVHYQACLDAFDLGKPPAMLSEYRIVFDEFCTLSR